MSKAGKRIIAGAREALAIAKGKKLPARVVMHGWSIWHPQYGLIAACHPTEQVAKEMAADMHGNTGWRGARASGVRTVRVKLEAKP